jgi:hypothetical protein
MHPLQTLPVTLLLHHVTERLCGNAIANSIQCRNSNLTVSIRKDSSNFLAQLKANLPGCTCATPLNPLLKTLRRKLLYWFRTLGCLLLHNAIQVFN